jgi:UDP-N-acetyl-D-mannosaminuronic acid dehydrogenase
VSGLAERLERREAPIAVAGLGRVGLPLAIALAGAGHRVTGIDVDPERLRSVELAKMPFDEPGTEDLLRVVVESGRLSVTDDAADALGRSDVIIFCIPTPLGADLRPDYVHFRAALARVGPHLRAGQLLLFRSTVSPGTLEKVAIPALREIVPDVIDHLLLAACPERIAEGKAMVEIATLPEIVGGLTPEAARAAGALFRTLGPDKVMHVTDPTSAELGKLFTNVFRYVNFALANEYALLGEHYGVDAHAIIRMVNEGYPRASIPRPGPAGGPCLSKDGYFLVEELTLPDFVLTAWKLNDSAPAHVVRRLRDRLRGHAVELRGATVAVLGRGFKRDNDDLRLSPAVRVAEILEREGALVRATDPYLPGPTVEEALAGAQGFVLATNHSAYDALDPAAVAAAMAEPRTGVDCWGVLDREAFRAAGIDVQAFGVGDDR